VEDDLGADVARTVAQGLLVYMRRAGGQAQFSAPLRARTPRTSLGAAIAAYIAENPTRPLTVAELAAHVNVSTRHVTRVIRDELGMTAAAYVAAVRLSIAVGLLESGAAVTEAATSAGFPPSLRCGARSRRSTG
jgi:transcriptional regulator GlxA family with amidase domain